MANLNTLANDVKTLTYRGIVLHLEKSGKEGKSVKDLMTHYASRWDVDLEIKAERDLVYRRVRFLLNCGTETDDIQKKGSAYVKMSPAEAEEHRKEVEKLAKSRAEVAAVCEKLKLNGDANIGEQSIAMTFAAFMKLAKKAS